MEVFRGEVELLDYVFFATVERGKVYETGPFLHNYALAYALGLASSRYAPKAQRPTYAEDLAPLNALGVYLTPARPNRALFRLMQWNTIRERYGFAKKERSVGYPDWGFARVLRPGSRFVFYLLTADPARAEGLPRLGALLGVQRAYVRLGKFSGKARVELQRAQAVDVRQGAFAAIRTGTEEGSHGPHEPILLNWRDFLQEPTVCDVLPLSLPTRLVDGPRFAEGSYYRARFADGTYARLPVDMAFLRRGDVRVQAR